MKNFIIVILLCVLLGCTTQPREPNLNVQEITWRQDLRAWRAYDGNDEPLNFVIKKTESFYVLEWPKGGNIYDYSKQPFESFDKAKEAAFEKYKRSILKIVTIEGN